MNTRRITQKFPGPVAFNASGDGVAVTTLTGTFTMTARDEQSQVLDGGVSNRNVVLPTASKDLKGAPWFINNAGSTNSLVVKDGGTTIATLNFGEQGMFQCTGTAWKVIFTTSSTATDVFTANGAYTGNNTYSGTETFSNAAGVTTNTLSERTADAGVTIDGVLCKDSVVTAGLIGNVSGNLSSDELVKATVTVGNATGGATGAALTLQLKQRNNSTNITSARQVLIKAGATQYQPEVPLEASLTFGTATTGSIIASGGGWALVETDATGAFACTATNTDDETLYFAVYTPPAGVSDLAKSSVVLASNSDAATWSA